jgi:hypothetical protein
MCSWIVRDRGQIRDLGVQVSMFVGSAVRVASTPRRADASIA